MEEIEVEESELSEGFQIKDGADDVVDDEDTTDIVGSSDEESEDDRKSSEPDDFSADDPELMAYMFNEEEL